MSDIKPELIERACDAYRRPNRMLTNDSATRHHDCMAAALAAVADDLRAEGAAEALREAADTWGAGEWQEAWLADAVEDDVSAVRSTVTWLRDRASRIEAGS